MDISNVFERLINVIKYEIPVNATDLTKENSLVKLDIDSISYIKLLVSLEHEFDIEFCDQDLDVSRFKTLEDFAEYIYQKITKPEL